jgi:hypothetical protein
MKRHLLTAPLALLLLLVSTLTLPGCFVETCTECNTPPPCSYGPNGYPGPAFFGLDYPCCAPTYVWTNNTAIPPTFVYGTYYNSMPGNYRLYYEGRFLNGCCYTEYHWDVNFDVWINAGTPGGCGFAGANGLPSYLMLVCGPDGPGQVRTNKMAEQGIQMNVISETANEVILQYVKGDINVRVSYHRLAESIKRELDPSGIVHADDKK